jgi:hypothetical protein
MINKDLLNKKMLDNQISGLLDKLPNPFIEIGGYKAEVSKSNNYINLYNPEKKLILEDLSIYVTSFTPELLDKEFNSILMGGLGLGLIPFVVQDFCETIDVIENNNNITQINQQLGALDSKVNIINDDIFTFQPTKMYDVIVMDIWYEPITVDIVDTLNSIYFPFLNEGGFLYYPINATSKEELPVIIKK